MYNKGSQTTSAHLFPSFSKTNNLYTLHIAFSFQVSNLYWESFILFFLLVYKHCKFTQERILSQLSKCIFNPTNWTRITVAMKRIGDALFAKAMTAIRNHMDIIHGIEAYWALKVIGQCWWYFGMEVDVLLELRGPVLFGFPAKGILDLTQSRSSLGEQVEDYRFVRFVLIECAWY